MNRLILVAFAVSVSTASFYAQTSGSAPASKPSSAGPRIRAAFRHRLRRLRKAAGAAGSQSFHQGSSR